MEYGKSEDAFRSAVTTREEDAATWNTLCVLFLENMASLHESRNDHSGVLKTYREAIAAAEMTAMLKPADPNYHAILISRFMS